MAIVTVLVMIGIYAVRVAALPKSEISQLPPEYQVLAEDCSKADSFNCCMSSVKTMAQGKYQLAKNPDDLSSQACPSGYQRNLLRCMGTKVWCEPR